LLRLGLADVASCENAIDWEEARRVSLLKNRNRDYPLQVAGVEEFGILDRSVSELTDPSLLPPDWKAAAARYAEAIDAKLERSRRKEIFIYVHGYKVVFDNPILVTAERPLKPHVATYIQRNDALVLIDVTDAEAAAAVNGHAYFRQSPWVSSDILTSLLYGLEPGKRGLVRLPGAPVWSFPEDYISRLQGLLREKLRGS